MSPQGLTTPLAGPVVPEVKMTAAGVGRRREGPLPRRGLLEKGCAVQRGKAGQAPVCAVRAEEDDLPQAGELATHFGHLVQVAAVHDERVGPGGVQRVDERRSPQLEV